MIVASGDAVVAMEIVVKLLEQTPGCSSDDTMAACKVQKIVHDVKFRHLESRKLREFLERGIEKLSHIYRKLQQMSKFYVMYFMLNFYCICCAYVCSIELNLYSLFCKQFLSVDIYNICSCYELCTLLYYFLRKTFIIVEVSYFPSRVGNLI